jgi:hypothetical protein
MTRTIELADEREGRERRPGHLGICLRVFGLTTVRASSPGDWHAPHGLFRFNSTKERIIICVARVEVCRMFFGYGLSLLTPSPPSGAGRPP